MAKKRKKQRGNGRGSVYYDRTKELWYAAVTRPDGKREKRSADTRDEAEKLLTRLLVTVRTPELLSAEKMTLADWLAIWLATAKRRLEAGSYANYERTVVNDIVPALGAINLANLRPVHIQQWVNTIAAAGLTKGTVGNKRALLTSALREAVRQEILERNPAEHVRVEGKAPERTRTALEEPQLRALLAACAAVDRMLFEMVVVIVALGLRRGDLIGIRESRLDLVRGTVRIDGQVRMEPSGPVYVERTKTNRPRIIRLPALIAALLAERLQITAQERAEHPEWPVNDFVWVDRRDGLPVRPYWLDRQFKVAANRASVVAVLHEMRHTAASLYVAPGASDTEVRDLLGHSSLSMTARYTHTLTGQTERAADAMGGLLERLTE